MIWYRIDMWGGQYHEYSKKIILKIIIPSKNIFVIIIIIHIYIVFFFFEITQSASFVCFCCESEANASDSQRRHTNDIKYINNTFVSKSAV